MIEVFGFATGVVNVWLLARQNIWNWPVGIANNLAYLLLFAKSGLYGDAGLRVVYIMLGIYGWSIWSRRGAEPQFSVTRISRRLWVWFGVTTLLADLVYIPLYIYKGLYLTSLLYFVFLLLCIFGIRQWGRELKADVR